MTDSISFENEANVINPCFPSLLHWSILTKTCRRGVLTEITKFDFYYIPNRRRESGIFSRPRISPKGGWKMLHRIDSTGEPPVILAISWPFRGPL
jgi:hypothetical protein